MYRCHFTFEGHIVAGMYLLATELDKAIDESRGILATMPALGPDCATGFEIWVLSDLLYMSD